MAFLNKKPTNSGTTVPTKDESPAQKLVNQVTQQGQPSPYSDRASGTRAQNCPHCGKDINTPPADVSNPALIQHYIDTLNDQSHQLTQWERDFRDSVAEQYEERGSLSPKQIATLRKIFEDKC